jgi:retron-type reverse transcriptase
MYEEIIDIKNIEAAYLDLVKRFDEEGKSSNLAGVDGLTLNDLNFVSSELLSEIQSELKTLTPLLPTLGYVIPKTTGGEREIFVYSIRDRIKAQAISRVLGPWFESQYSPFLFSYRSSHPTYYASKAVAKRYKRYFGEDTVFKGDVSKYTDSLDKKTLLLKLEKAGLDKSVIELLKLFIFNSTLKGNKIVKPKVGVMQGVPLIPHFANFYLNDLDNIVGKKVSLYRRVGDDFIIFDRDFEKVSGMKNFILDEAKKLKLEVSLEKTKIFKSNERFSFVGYVFENKKIRIRDNSVKKALLRWSRKLKYFNASDFVKKRKLEAILYKDVDSIHNQFVHYIATYRQADDYNQIKSIFEKFLRILTKYFFETYSERNQRILLNDILKGMKIPSLYKYFIDFHNGRKTIPKLSLSKEN